MADPVQDLILQRLDEVQTELRTMRREAREDRNEAQADVARAHGRIDSLQKIVADDRVDIGKLKVRSSVWGAVGGVLVAAGATLWRPFT